MNYLRTAIDLVRGSETVSYVEACRFGRDAMHGAAASFLIAAVGVELAADGTRGSALALGLTMLAGAAEMGAGINNSIVKQRQA